MVLTKFTMKLKEAYQKPRFALRLMIAFLVLLIDVLWAFLKFPGGRRDFSTMILFAYGPPTFLVIFWGLLVAYLCGAEPSAVLIISWESVGIGVFLTISGLQIACMTVVENAEHIIQLAVMVFLDCLAGILLILDLILTNKQIINNAKIGNSSPNKVLPSKIK